MKNSKVAIPVFLIILLSMIGISYSAWFDTILVTGTSRTGEVMIAFPWWEAPSIQEAHIMGDEWWPVVFIPGEHEDKNVASATAHYEDPIYPDGDCCDCPPYDFGQGLVDWGDDAYDPPIQGYRTLVLNYYNVYPGYAGRVEFIPHSIGTIPTGLYEYVFQGIKVVEGGSDIPLGFDPLDFPGTSFVGYVFEDYDGDGIKDDDEPYIAGLKVADNVPRLLLECWEAYFGQQKPELDIFFRQPMDECSTYRFWIQLRAIQWNKLYEAEQGIVPWPDFPPQIT